MCRSIQIEETRYVRSINFIEMFAHMAIIECLRKTFFNLRRLLRERNSYRRLTLCYQINIFLGNTFSASLYICTYIHKKGCNYNM